MLTERPSAWSSFRSHSPVRFSAELSRSGSPGDVWQVGSTQIPCWYETRNSRVKLCVFDNCVLIKLWTIFTPIVHDTDVDKHRVPLPFTGASPIYGLCLSGIGLSILWMYGLTLCGPLRTLLLYGQADAVPVAVLVTIFSGQWRPMSSTHRVHRVSYHTGIQVSKLRVRVSLFPGCFSAVSTIYIAKSPLNQN